MKTGLLILLLFASGAFWCRACDLCGCYMPQLETMPDMEQTELFPKMKGWYASVAEQFTRFATVQVDGREVPNPTGQYENSSITQLIAGYSINDRFALQLNLPLIYREFKRPEGFAIDRGSESGIGDMSLLAKLVAFRYQSGGGRSFEPDGKNVIIIQHEPDFTFSALVLIGLKFPTGDTSRLKEEFHEIDIPGAPVSGIHGHDLTLGTGSYDGISVARHRCDIEAFSPKQICSSRFEATVPINIISRTTWVGAADLDFTSFEIHVRSWSRVCCFGRAQRYGSISWQSSRRYRNYVCVCRAARHRVARALERGSRS